MHTKSMRPMTQIQLSPVSFLPSEVLVHIFQHGIDEVPHSAHALPRPFTLAGVCRNWRAVVLCTPELWTHVFVTSATTIDHLQACLERSGNFEIEASFCNWLRPQDSECGVICNIEKAFLESIVGALCRHAHRLRTLSLWDVSDAVVCAVINGLLNIQTPRLTTVSVRANHTVYYHYYQLRHPYLLPFLSGKAPLLTRLEINHFPIETLHTRSDYANMQNLTSLMLRTQECPTVGYSLPPYLIEFPALCTLLRSTPNLVSLALHGPIIEPDEDFPLRPPGVTLPALETLIVHRCDPGVRYHCELLSILSAPALKRLEIPWHDDLSVELPHADRTRAYLFQDQDDDDNGGGSRPLRPRFANVRELYLHDSAVERQLPARSFVEAFPRVEEVMLGGTDVVSFAEALRESVCPRRTGTGSLLVGPYPDGDECDDDAGVGAMAGDGRSTCPLEYEFNRSSSVLDELEGNAWQAVKKVVLKEPEMEAERWNGWVSGFCRWLAAEGHTSGEICVEIREVKFPATGASKNGKFDDGRMKTFKRGLDRLRRYARVVVM